MDKDRLINLAKNSKFREFHEKWAEGWLDIKDDVKRINRNQLALYLNSILPLAIDGTSNSTAVVLRRKGLLEGFGYDTAMIFVNTSIETAIQRASKRERHVDPEFIEDAYKQINKAKPFYRSTFSDWKEINNDEGQLTEKSIVDAFKHMSSFYDRPISNPVGKEYKEKIILHYSTKRL